MILRTEIVGIRMAQEGNGGYTTNYTFYSVLVFTDDGRVDLVEGQYHQIAHLLRYVSPRLSQQDFVSMMERFENSIKKSFDEVLQTNIGKVYNAVFPVPDVRNKTGPEAREILENAGFLVSAMNPRMDLANPKGLVLDYVRNLESPKQIVLDIIPVLTGLSSDEAIQTLESYGFEVTKKVIYRQEYDEDQIIRIERVKDTQDCINIFVNKKPMENNVSAEVLFIQKIQDETTMAGIAKLWEFCDLAGRFSNINNYIKMRTETEREEGPPKNLAQIKDIIIQMLQKEIGSA